MGVAHDLVRSASGGVVHRAQCHHITERHIPWRWAEGRTIVEVFEATKRNGLWCCRDCAPLIPEMVEVIKARRAVR